MSKREPLVKRASNPDLREGEILRFSIYEDGLVISGDGDHKQIIEQPHLAIAASLGAHIAQRDRAGNSYGDIDEVVDHISEIIKKAYHKAIDDERFRTVVEEYEVEDGEDGRKVISHSSCELALRSKKVKNDGFNSAEFDAKEYR